MNTHASPPDDDDPGPCVFCGYTGESDQHACTVDQAGSEPPPIGSTVEWSTLGGATYRGVVTEIDNEDMVVMCDDGVVRVTGWE